MHAIVVSLPCTSAAELSYGWDLEFAYNMVDVLPRSSLLDSFDG